MTTLTELTDAYASGAELLRRAVAGLTREQQLARPVPGRWSTLEVVCHLADFEPVFADRIKRVIALDEPPLVAADENRFAARLAYHDRDMDEELGLIDLTRRQLVRILRQLPDAARERVGMHSERGRMTLGEILTYATRHVAHHLPFLAEKRLALEGAESRP
jgi:uncharacterized damage-inducible protein DinB